jgi:hypothetical protein
MIYDNDVRSDKVPRQTTGPHVDYTFLYQYAVGGALAKVRYPSLNWVSYDINGANRISKVRMGETGTSYYMQNAAYNPAGALVGATIGLDGANQWTEEDPIHHTNEIDSPPLRRATL